MIVRTAGGWIEIEEQPGIVTKRLWPYGFDVHGRAHRETRFLKSAGPIGLAPEHLADGYNWVRMRFESGQRLDSLLESANTEQRLSLMDLVVEAAFRLHCLELNHCDLHDRNIIVRPNGSVCLIDGEWCRPIPNTLAVADGYDFAGRRHWDQSPIPAPASMYHGNLMWDPIKRLAAILQVEALKASGSSPLIPNPVITYHSFDLPGLQVEGQRNCRERWTTYMANGVGVNRASVLDLGCNIGGMVIDAKKNLGAGSCCGIDITAERIAVAERIARFAGAPITFRVGDLRNHEMIRGLPAYDVILLGAVSAYMTQEETRSLASDVAALCKPEGVIVWEDNAGIDPDAIWAGCGMEAKQIGRSTDDAFETNHFRRIYLCRHKR